MKLKTIKKACILFFLLIPFVGAFAQDNDFNDDVQDIPAAPINNYIVFAVIIALFLGYNYSKRKPLRKNLLTLSNIKNK